MSIYREDWGHSFLPQFLDGLPEIAMSIPQQQIGAETHHRAGKGTSLRHQNFECDLSIIPSTSGYSR